MSRRRVARTLTAPRRAARPAWQPPHVPKRLPPGMQNVTAHVRMRLATCEEVDCPRFLNGWTEAPGGPFTGERMGIYHEAGTPCPEIHKRPDERFRPMYSFESFNRGRVTVTEDEYLQRLGEGTESLRHIILRGL